jgi:hypothetical protein
MMKHNPVTDGRFPMTQHEIIISEIEHLLEKTRKLGQNGEHLKFFDTLAFIKQSRYLAPYNGLLVMQQRPDATFVLSAERWQARFNRMPKQGAHPIVILKHFGPVEFVYDISDIEGIEQYPLPGYHPNLPTEELCRHLYPTEGDYRGIEGLFSEMVRTCTRQGLRVDMRHMEIQQAGSVQLIDAHERLPLKELNKAGRLFNYKMQINGSHPVEIRFAALIHELAHIYCGHFNEFGQAGFKAKTRDDEEFEAEAVAYLFCYRYGFRPKSEQYLVQYLTEGRDPSIANFESIIRAHNKIEALLDPEDIEDAPSVLDIAIGGYFGDSYSLRLAGTRLIYEERGAGCEVIRTEQLTPSAKDWGAFWLACQKYGVWYWNTSYEDNDIVDGTNWHLHIRLQDREISTGGSNAYPGDQVFPEEGTDEYPLPFKRFLNAVKRLAGGLPFK